VGEPIGVGVVGMGAISEAYLETLDVLTSLRLLAVCDVEHDRAVMAAERRPGVRPLAVDELLADPEVDVVVNLTPPAHHSSVALAAIAAGKSVYNEKPLAVTVAEGRELLRAAAIAGVRVGAAPDTVLGRGVQSARHYLDAGLIGPPSAAVASFMCPGHESWHPRPEFYYALGGGPLYDMGPYYVTALVTLLGPAMSVVGAGNAPRTTRTIRSGPRAGETIPVEVLTHVAGIVTHESGAVSTITMSFDAVGTRAEPIEVHGPVGSLVVPDPNRFDGSVLLRSVGNNAWSGLPEAGGYAVGGRGIGVAELMTAHEPAHARTSGALALHVLNVLEALIDSAREGRAIEVTSPAIQPAPVPMWREPSWPS
jgi:predicted dehydrogenase